jgi:hypothetical protein
MIVQTQEEEKHSWKLMERSDTRNIKYHEVFGNVRENVPHCLKRNSNTRGVAI